MDTQETYKIKPAGRHILTIGRDLIKDRYAAIVELVKNAYDADAREVMVSFQFYKKKGNCKIVISDDGHGMSPEKVINGWMVPSTTDKVNRERSPSGRIMQGRKGVGRYAASILGKDLLLETISTQSEKTTIFIEWKEFEKAQYLDDVEILIETTKVTEKSGTRLTITTDSSLQYIWSNQDFKKLRFELKKLISPASSFIKQMINSEDFHIRLEVHGFQDESDSTEIIEPYPIIDLFDYRIAGRIECNGTGTFIFSMQKARNAKEEIINFDLKEATGCGELVFDIRVYDREKEAIDSLIGRGLKDEAGNYLGNLQARHLLNDYNGIGVYRNGFRIRPLGDPDFDWLKLNEARVQNPSLRIGNNQAIGYVFIQSEKDSDLKEKSARDGLYENHAFDQLRKITKIVLGHLEDKRFLYRKKAGLSRNVLKVEKQLEQIFSFDELKKDIQTKLTRAGVKAEILQEIIKMIDYESSEKNKAVEEVRQAVAIYQGQATLGKIINVILHEGRRPLNFFRNEIPALRYWYDSFIKKRDMVKIEKILNIAEGIGNNAEFLVMLFNRIDPLAAAKRASKKSINLKKSINKAIAVFENNLKEQNIDVSITGSDTYSFITWEQDIYAIFVNLLDNSVYWMENKKNRKKEIKIHFETDGNNLLHIDYRDTGPGIEPSLIDSEVIFEPQFTTKPSGTGLGLAIAGEAAVRIGLELRAFSSESGAWFRLQNKTE